MTPEQRTAESGPRLRVLVACEFSGIVREAFRKLGHDAWSCDILPAEDGSPHHMRVDQCWSMADPLESPTLNIFHVLKDEMGEGWDLVIAHPPCTFLANSGVRWLYTNGRGSERDETRWTNMRAGAKFFADLWNACGDAPRCFENPVMHRYAATEIDRWASVPFGKHPDLQFIDPRDFGHTETKRTGLYLRGLPHLQPTKRVHSEAAALSVKERSRVHYASPGPDRWKERSRTLTGIAQAMAEQWTAHLLSRPPTEHNERKK